MTGERHRIRIKEMESFDSLLTEMLQRFNEIPPETVKAHVKLYPRNRPALLSELTRVSATLGAVRGEHSSQINTDFETPGLDNMRLESLPMPEPPPTLIITPPQSPEKKTAPKLCIGENVGYEDFLLQNQKDRLHALEEATRKDREVLMRLREEVRKKEKLFYEKSIELRDDYPSVTIDTLLELAQANRQLCVQDHCLVTEVDLHTDGTGPLGFHDNIYRGQDNPMVITQQSSHRQREKPCLPEPAPRWNCEHCTFENHPEIHNCEMCMNSRPSTSSIVSSKFPVGSSDDETSSSDSLSLPDSSGCDTANEGIEIEVKKEPRGKSPICLRIRQRTPKDTVTFRFYKNINKD